MKKHTKDVLLCFATAVIVCFTFYAPSLYFRIKDRPLTTQNHARKLIVCHLDSDADDIYLIKLVHAFYKSSYSDNTIVEHNTDKIAITAMSNVEIQMDALESAGILSASFTQWNKNLYHDSVCLASVENEVEDLYAMIKVIVSDEYTMWYTIEIKTGKILDLQIHNIHTADFPPISTIDRKTMIERYIRYLDLDILDDWKYNGNSYYSEKAKLRVDLELTDNSLSVKILPIDYKLLTDNCLIF